jgi:hypothetical protein
MIKQIGNLDDEYVNFRFVRSDRMTWDIAEKFDVKGFEGVNPSGKTGSYW